MCIRDRARAEDADVPIAASEVPTLGPRQPFSAEFVYAPLPRASAPTPAEEEETPSVADLPRFGSAE
eukprot:8602098-Alexandrium_andersonii.AAC.1